MILILLLIFPAGPGSLTKIMSKIRIMSRKGPSGEIFAMRTCMSATVIDYRSAAAAAPEK